MRPDSRRIGSILRESGAITPRQLKRALRHQANAHRRLGEVLVDLGYLDDEFLARALSTQFGYPYLDLKKDPPDPSVADTVPGRLVRRRRVVPVSVSGGKLLVALADPLDAAVLDQTSIRSEHPVQPGVAPASGIRRVLERRYGEVPADPSPLESPDRGGSTNGRETGDARGFKPGSPAAEPSVMERVNGILNRAVRRNASDIHVEPFGNKLSLRVRVDGVLHDLKPPPKHLHGAVVSRLKIMADMDIAETRTPQDGRFERELGGKRYDFRVSTLPTVHGESVVIRVLGQKSVSLRVSRLGMSPAVRDAYARALEEPGGMVLVTGPTGSGKTTTLFAGLNRINHPGVKIVTLEDPIEYELPGLIQCQINEQVEFSFARGLRSLLRQDPDACLVGEIRDRETASIALQASLTGHLVFSTLHTTDAATAITRFLDMGMPSFLVSATLRAVIGQRLVRLVCTNCRRYDPAPDRFIRLAGQDPDRWGERCFVRGSGCERCGQTGYRGRSGIFELIEVKGEIRRMIHENAGADAIRRRVRESGGGSMLSHGWVKTARGMTTVRELVRVAPLTSGAAPEAIDSPRNDRTVGDTPPRPSLYHGNHLGE